MVCFTLIEKIDKSSQKGTYGIPRVFIVILGTFKYLQIPFGDEEWIQEVFKINISKDKLEGIHPFLTKKPYVDGYVKRFNYSYQDPYNCFLFSIYTPYANPFMK